MKDKKAAKTNRGHVFRKLDAIKSGLGRIISWFKGTALSRLGCTYRGLKGQRYQGYVVSYRG